MNKKILVVDDVEINRELLEEIFIEEYLVEQAEDGIAAEKILDERCDEFAAVLLDIFMPNATGIEVLKYMSQKGYLQKLPVLMITADNSIAGEKECFDLGAVDFIRKPFNPILVRTRVNNAVSLFSYKNSLEDQVEAQTEELRAKNEQLAVQNEILKEQSDKLRQNNKSIIEVLGDLVETRSLESGEHVHRVQSYTKALAYAMMDLHPEYELTEEKIEIIVEASALHDLGKIAIPDAILLKPGKLTDEEFVTMKSHTSLGSEYVKQIGHLWEADYSKACYEISRHHHERFDGRGYPDGLKGDEIPISAQLVSVADVYDALIHERCYKPAFPLDEAFDMIMTGKCGTFSPKLMECLKACFPFEKAEAELLERQKAKEESKR